MAKKYLEEKWDYLRGSQEEFSFENRMVNSISVITFQMVFLLLVFNVALSLFEEAFICLVVLMLDVFVYYLARYRKQYRTSIAIYIIGSYLALFFVYYYNSGISGPTLFFFFLTFQVIATVTPKKHHFFWAVLHVFFASALCFIEYKFPDLIKNGYGSRQTRFADVVFSFVICLFFVYLITIHLRNNLDRIRKKSSARAEEIEAHLHEIEEQNERLKEISWLQSHKVRSQVATILGLSQFVNQGNIEDPDLNMVIGGIKEAAKELDDVIKEINRLTNSADINK
jgi:hypothetical protein